MRTIAFAAAAAIVIAGAAAGGWQLAGHRASHAANTGLAARTDRPSPERSASAPPTAETSPSPGTPGTPGTPSATASPPGGAGPVTVAPGAAQNPAASQVTALVSQYFAAINAHNYQAYMSLLTPQEQQSMTASQFAAGYRSTADSKESLAAISSAANGDTVAQVTFTSHQNPADSVNGAQSCTDWQISLFLVQNGGGYLIDQPPSGYHASYAACP
ncbi:MAG: hypothetical protein JOY82_28330 [Streptosporangiaceae bacterium]|nr:hypothetical protein [Streptosporangiaceae bacterium]MBV9858393.1 hypothetical protein [Streptosporangiaceae bacterium]